MVRRETYWTTITDSEGAVEQELSYDAWGNLRNPNTWCVDASITKRRNIHSVLKIPLPPLLAERLGGKLRHGTVAINRSQETLQLQFLQK